jgi:predicted DNA binding protein
MKYPAVKCRIISSNILKENEVTVLMHASCDVPDQLVGFLHFWEKLDKTTEFMVSARTEKEAVFTVSLRDYTEHVTRYILENKGFFTTPVTVFDGKENWSIVLSDEDSKKNLFIHLDEIGDVTIDEIQRMDHLNMALPLEYVSLTDRQSESLCKAYQHGYYDFPKKTSSRDLARHIGVSQSTLLEHLHKAEHKIISKLVHHM